MSTYFITAVQWKRMWNVVPARKLHMNTMAHGTTYLRSRVKPYPYGGNGMEEAIQRGCLFCRTGKEAEVIQRFKRCFLDGRALTPTRTRYRRRSGTAIEERVPLLPGYVFFEIKESAEDLTETELALRQFVRTDGVIKLLKYTDGCWQLHGFDDQFAKLLFNGHENIGLSQAWFDEGKRIRILSGFLKDYEGAISRVNKKKKTVEIQIDLQGKKVSLWLGYELVEPLNE